MQGAGMAWVGRSRQGRLLGEISIAKYEKRPEWGKEKRIAERLVRRYQIDGVWGLAPERDPERIHRQRSNQAPPIEYAEADRRLALITQFLGKRLITNDELREYAKKHSLSWRSLRNHLA
jgi:hypothetical protein